MANLDPIRVGMLRQWINEDLIINNQKKTLITNEDIVFWLTPLEVQMSKGIIFANVIKRLETLTDTQHALRGIMK